MKYLETTVKMQKLTERGVQKKVREKYLVNAITVGEAENNIIDALKPFISGEFSVVSVRQSSIDSVFDCGGHETYYIVKFDSETIDERTGQVTRMRFQALFLADDVKSALKKAQEEFRGHEIVSIQKSKIVDVF